MSKGMLSRILIGALTAGMLVGTAAQSASAGSYHVYSCRTPAGEPAPADGWSGSTAQGSAYDDHAADTCSSGGALIASLGEATKHEGNVDQATWSFQTPAFDHMAGATLWRAGYLHGLPGENATYEFWFSAPKATELFDECLLANECHAQGEYVRPLAAVNRIAIPAADLGAEISMNVSCATGIPGSECGDGFTDPNGYAAAAYLFAADITLEQAQGPAAQNVSGELANASSVSGTSDIDFQASDPGSGVYEAVFSIDGQVVQRTVLDEDGGRCRDVGQSADGLPAFLYVQPCAASVSADAALDTTRFANGVHHLVVDVTDAAGNEATVLDRNITIANPVVPAVGTAALPGAANGTNASSSATLSLHWKGAKGSHLTSTFGRAVIAQGLLTAPGGQPIAGASVEVSSTAASQGARPAATAAVVTGADGRFSATIARGGSSRSLRFSYRAHAGEAGPAASGTLTLTVRAAVSLAISPRVTAMGRLIHFKGRLLGGPVPASGKLLVLEARSPGGRWIEFHVVRSRRGGLYTAGYRFRFPGPHTYQFRVVCEPEADYAYGAGVSRVLSVYEA